MSKLSLRPYSLCYLVTILISLPAYAGTSAGIDTPLGTAALPLAVQGVAGCTLNANPTDATQPPSLDCQGTITSVGDSWVGSSSSAGVTWTNGTAEVGPKLHISGATGMNSDDIYFQRWNTAKDQSVLQLAIGDNAGELYPNTVGDTFQIGAYDSGLYYPRYTFTGYGYLGIGTTKPIVPLDVLAPTVSNNATGILVEGSSAANSSPRIGMIDTSLGSNTTAPAWFIDNDSDNFRVFRQPTVYTSGAAMLEINNAGNVGIGTSSPNGATLQVDGAPNSYMALYLEATGTGNIPQYLQFGKNGVKQWDLAGGGLDNNLYIQNIPDETAGTHNGGDIVTFTPSGNVGVGTTTPASTLTVSSPTADTWFGLENTSAAGNYWAEISSGTGSWVTPGSFNIGHVYNNFTNFAASLSIVPTGNIVLFNVGINNPAPAYALDVNGTVNATGGAGALSDRRHKKDIEPLLIGGLDAVEKLKPVTFHWKDPKDNGMKGEQIGFIAQDVQKVLPDAIMTADDKDKTLSLKYDALIPVLTKALQEQQKEIAAQREEIEALKKDVAAIKEP